MIEIFIFFSMLILSAFFSGVENAIVGLNPLNISHGDRQKLTSLYRKKERIIATCLVGNNFSIVGATLAVSSFIAGHESAAFGVALFLFELIFFFFFAEVLPKSLFRKLDLVILKLFFWPVLFFYYLFYPLSITFIKIMNTVLFLFFKNDDKDLKKEDVFYHVSSKLSEERLLITRDILRLEKTLAKEIMTPMPDVFSLPQNATVDEALEIIEESHYSRYPVYDHRIDNITGFISVLDFLKLKKTDRISAVLHDAVFIPEFISIDKILFRMQVEKVPLVFVVNEHGLVLGIITREDIAEELVGEILTEEQKNEAEHIIPANRMNDVPDLKRISAKKRKKIFFLDGNLDIDDFNEYFSQRIKKEGFETITGFVIKKLGHIPKKKEMLDLEMGKFIIEKADEKTIHQIRYVLK